MWWKISHIGINTFFKQIHSKIRPPMHTHEDIFHLVKTHCYSIWKTNNACHTSSPFPTFIHWWNHDKEQPKDVCYSNKKKDGKSWPKIRKKTDYIQSCLFNGVQVVSVVFHCICENILRGYLYVFDLAFSHHDGIHGFKFPSRFLGISCRDLTSLYLN